MNSSLVLRTLLFIAILAGLTSCGGFDDIEIGDPQEIKIKGFENEYLVMNVALPVSNPTIHKVSIKEMDVRVFLNEKYIGKLIVNEKVSFKANQDAVYQLPVKIRLVNMLSTAFIMMNLKKGQESVVKFEGEVKAGTFFFTKKFEISETTRFKY